MSCNECLLAKVLHLKIDTKQYHFLAMEGFFKFAFTMTWIFDREEQWNVYLMRSFHFLLSSVIEYECSSFVCPCNCVTTNSWVRPFATLPWQQPKKRGTCWADRIQTYGTSDVGLLGLSCKNIFLMGYLTACTLLYVSENYKPFKVNTKFILLLHSTSVLTSYSYTLEIELGCFHIFGLFFTTWYTVNWG